MRIVGLDVGERRIGVAVSDPTGLLARPLEVVTISGLERDGVVLAAKAVARLASEDDGVGGVVVGLPRRLDGTANDMTSRVERFAAGLRERVGVPVSLQDERLSSHEADARLAARNRDWRSRKARLDAAAAAVILQDYLDART